VLNSGPEKTIVDETRQESRRKEQSLLCLTKNVRRQGTSDGSCFTKRILGQTGGIGTKAKELILTIGLRPGATRKKRGANGDSNRFTFSETKGREVKVIVGGFRYREGHVKMVLVKLGQYWPNL